MLTLVPGKRGELATSALVRFSAQASNVFMVEEPLLNLSMHGPKELMVGDSATQSITISNPGTGIAHNVTIEARITKGLEHPHGERLTVQIGSFNPGETRVVRLPLVAVAGGPQTIAIHASAAGDLHRELTTKITVVAPQRESHGRRAELSIRGLQGGLPDHGRQRRRPLEQRAPHARPAGGLPVRQRRQRGRV